MMMDDDVLLDTNILITATETSRAHYGAARWVLDRWPRLYVCGQVLREYLVVATRSRAQNGLGMPLTDALANVGALHRSLEFLPEDEHVVGVFHGLLQQVPCLGRQLHDANLVAVALRHGVRAILTENKGHFARFAHRIVLPELPDLTT